MLQALQLFRRPDSTGVEALLVACHALAHLVDVGLELVLLAGDVAHRGLRLDQLDPDRCLLAGQLGELGELGQAGAPVLELRQGLVDRLQVEQSGLLVR